mmetsp:Transcript_7138/g.18491  ORF Transcript_7138/g.18491 Transcript_7138/m.18491 type:complete len:233 (-) Transcript_7138:6-704(-)
MHFLRHRSGEPLPFDARKGMDVLPEVVALVDRVQRALEAVRRRLPLTLVRSYDVRCRRIRVLLEVLDRDVAAPLAADGPRTLTSLAPFPRDAAPAEAPRCPRCHRCESVPPGRFCCLRLGARPADDGLVPFTVRARLPCGLRRHGAGLLVHFTVLPSLLARPARLGQLCALATWHSESAAAHVALWCHWCAAAKRENKTTMSRNFRAGPDPHGAPHGSHASSTWLEVNSTDN